MNETATQEPTGIEALQTVSNQLRQFADLFEGIDGPISLNITPKAQAERYLALFLEAYGDEVTIVRLTDSTAAARVPARDGVRIVLHVPIDLVTDAPVQPRTLTPAEVAERLRSKAVVTKSTDVVRDPWVGWFRGLWSGGAS